MRIYPKINYRNITMATAIVTAAFLISVPITAAVKPGADFLRMDTGARPSGMAGAFTAAADDVNSLWWRDI